MSEPVRARELAITFPSLQPDAPAVEAARLLAEDAVEGVFVQDEHGGLQGVVTDTTLLAFLLPRYLAEDRALVRVLGEDVADALWQRLGGRTVGDLLPAQAGVAEVNADDTLVAVAATLARSGAALVAVRDRDRRLLGGITTSRLLRRLLEAR